MTHQLNGEEVIVIEVPEHSYDIVVCNDDAPTIELSISGSHEDYGQELPPGYTYSILLDTKEAGEEDYKKVVDSTEWHFPERHTVYRDYEKPLSKPNGDQWRQEWNVSLPYAKLSFHSFLRSNGYDPSKRYVLISQNKK